jgi:hypothetical protein
MSTSPKQIRNATIGFTLFFLLSVMGLAWSLGGCGAKNPPTAGSVHKTITTVIADAGTVAISAEQQYKAGSIPQTETTRTAINDLGNAYEFAKRVYLRVLAAETTFQHAQQAQLAACAPAATTTDPCKAATAAVQQDQLALDSADATLSTSINTLVSKTSAVKTLTKQ